MRRARNWHLVAVLNYLIVVWLLWIAYGTDKPEKKEAETEYPNRLEWVVER